MPEEIGSPERHRPPLVPYAATSEVFRASECRGLGEPAKWHERTVVIKSSELLLRGTHPSEEAVEVLAVAGDFGRAAALSLFSAPLPVVRLFGLRLSLPRGAQKLVTGVVWLRTSPIVPSPELPIALA